MDERSQEFLLGQIDGHLKGLDRELKNVNASIKDIHSMLRCEGEDCEECRKQIDERAKACRKEVDTQAAVQQKQINDIKAKVSEGKVIIAFLDSTAGRAVMIIGVISGILSLILLVRGAI
jgi:DNA-binding transcriptional MerR regulator